MGERAPVPRSPIGARPATPGAAPAEASLQLADTTALGKVLVRAAPHGRIAGRLGVACGRAARDGRGTLVSRFGPDEWLLFTAPGRAGAVVAELEDAGDDVLVSVIDLTSGRAAMRLTGARAPDVLAKVCAVDAGTPPDGTAFRSLVGGVVTEVVRDDGAPGERSYLLASEWSLGRYLFDVLVDAGAEFGLAVADPLEWVP